MLGPQQICSAQDMKRLNSQRWFKARTIVPSAHEVLGVCKVPAGQHDTRWLPWRQEARRDRLYCWEDVSRAAARHHMEHSAGFHQGHLVKHLQLWAQRSRHHISSTWPQTAEQTKRCGTAAGQQ